MYSFLNKHMEALGLNNNNKSIAVAHAYAEKHIEAIYSRKMFGFNIIPEPHNVGS